MQGRNNVHPQLFAYIDIERLIPETHLLRKIHKVVDLSFVRDLTKSYYCDDNGRPSIDPEAFFGCTLSHTFIALAQTVSCLKNFR